MQIIITIRAILAEFGWLGWYEMFAAALVAIGCGGELWLLMNRLTRRVRPMGDAWYWRVFHWADVRTRPVCLFLKINRRKISHVKENFLERLFTLLVAVGVGLELIGVLFAIHELAEIKGQAGEANRQAGVANEKAGKANREAAESREQAALTESHNLLLQSNVLVLRSNVLALELKLKPRSITVEQMTNLIGLIKKAPRGLLRFGSRNADAETEAYMAQFRFVFSEADYPVESVMDYNDQAYMKSAAGHSVYIACESNSPPHFGPIVDAFKTVGIQPFIYFNTNVIEQHRFKIGENAVMIFFTEKRKM